MWLRRGVVALCLLGSSACTAAQPSSPKASARAEARPAARVVPPARLYLEPGEATSSAPEELRFVGMDDGPVPEFRLRTTKGEWFDSRQLVGEEPFVIVFFATWCAVCELKLPMLRQALRAAGPVRVIGVAVDSANTWQRVAPYVSRHGFSEMPIVRAESFPRFAISYNPFETVPLVVVVGKNGGLVDYQVGYEPRDEQRLEAAVRLAKEIGPLKAQPSQ